MRWLRIVGGMAICVLACVYTASAQNVVTGTIHDANGNAYANGTASALLVVISGQPQPPSTNVTTNAAGFFTMTLATGSYSFIVCAAPTGLPPVNPVANSTPRQICFSSAPILINSNPQDVSTTLNAIALSLGPGSASGTATCASFGIVCMDGVTYALNSTGLTAACTAAGSSGTVIISKPVVMTATVACGAELHFFTGGTITTTGWTLNLNGPLRGPDATLFLGTGTVNLNSVAVSQGVRSIWFPGTDWPSKANAADASCGAGQCTIIMPNATASGVATTIWTPGSHRNYVFDAGQWTSSASPMANIAAGTQQLSINGAGLRTTDFVLANSTGDYFQVNGTMGSNVNNLTFQGFGTDSSMTRTAGNVFNLTWTQPTTVINNVQAVNYFNFVSCNTGCANVVISNIFNQLVAAGGSDIIINPGNATVADLILGPNYFSDAAIANSTSHGIVWQTGDSVFVYGPVNIVRHLHGLEANPSVGNTIHFGFFDQLIVDTSAGEGIQIGTGAGNAQVMTFENSWVATSQGSNANIDIGGGSQDFRWSNGKIVNGTGNGIVLNGGTNSYIATTTISGNSTASSGTNHGVVVVANVGSFSLIGNRCGQVAGFQNTQGFGIVVNAGTSNNYSILGNDCSTNVTGGVSDAGTGASKNVYGNLPTTTNGTETLNNTYGVFGSMQVQVLAGGGPTNALDLFDVTSSASNPHKYIRVNGGNLQFLNSGFNSVIANLTDTGSWQAQQVIANQGTACTNGELALSAGWQSTGSATVTGAAGTGQTCSWIITTGTTTAANPTITDTLTNALPTATTVCWMSVNGGTHTPVVGAGTSDAFRQTTLSTTAPIFTYQETPTAGGTTYFVTRVCGP